MVCMPYLGHPVTQVAGTCIPFNEATTTCLVQSECDNWVEGGGATDVATYTVNFGRFSCVDGYCRPCNGTYWGNVTKTCTGWDHATQTGSSLPGETRSCNATTGWFIGGGHLDTPTPAPTTLAPTSPPSSSSTTAITSRGGSSTSDALTIEQRWSVLFVSTMMLTVSVL